MLISVVKVARKVVPYVIYVCHTRSRFLYKDLTFFIPTFSNSETNFTLSKMLY